jgi:phytoene synthase
MVAVMASGEPLRASDLAAARALLRSGSRSFYLASLLLPQRMRDDATALYAFCRLADDAVDLPGDGALAIAQLQAQLDRIYSGRPAPLPVERLLARTVQQQRIPRALLDALLEGFAWDAAGRRYETLADLHAYAARVAGSVGAMMTLLLGVRAPGVLARACDLGIAMQLTNIARDVGQDARLGRIYLPLGWLREAGIDPETWLAKPEFTPALAQVIERLLAAADELYARSASGIEHLPAFARPGVHAARLLYAEIGHELRRQGHDAIHWRARVGARRKLVLLGGALRAALAVSAQGFAAPVEAAQFLVNAAGNGAELPRRALPSAAVARAPQQGRVEWLIDLFERLERAA